MKKMKYGLTDDVREEIAKELYKAEKSVSSIDLLSKKYPKITIDDAYDIQKRGLNLRLKDGEELVGRKIGITSRGMMKMLSVDTPDFGYLLRSGMVLEGSSCKRDKMNIPIIEGEIAFVMGEDLPADKCVTPTDIINSVSFVVPCFEICDARFSSWKVTVKDTISDCAGASRFVLGSCPLSIFDVNLRNIGMVVEKNGSLLGTGAGAEVMGSPVNSVAWLANTLSDYGDSLKEGDIVLSGAFIAAEPCDKGDVFSLSVDGFPTLSVRFE